MKYNPSVPNGKGQAGNNNYCANGSIQPLEGATKATRDGCILLESCKQQTQGEDALAGLDAAGFTVAAACPPQREGRSASLLLVKTSTQKQYHQSGGDWETPFLPLLVLARRGAEPVKTGTGNSFPRTCQRVPKIITSTGNNFW